MSEKILPIPCTNVKKKTVKEWLQKINEELDEFKYEVTKVYNSSNVLIYEHDFHTEDETTRILYEAIDTITVITSMLEAMGIDESKRQEAQRRVNERNRERGRI